MTNSLLLEHFDDLIATPDDVELLDRAILYLALQGKLVPQDPSDEPASELIKRIHESNHKQKIYSKDSINEKPYDLPLDWMWTALPEIGEVNPRNQEVDDTKESSFIPMTYIPEEYAGELKFDIRPWGEIRKGFTHLRENDVAVAKITPCFENGKAVVMKGLVNGIGAGTTELHVFRGNPEFVLPEYVLMFFKNYKFREDGKRKMTGSAGQQRVPKEHITLTPFPLPPFAEQQRIVARVEELFAQTRALAKELAHSQIQLDGLNQSALSHLLASETPEEFNGHWDFIAAHFDLLFQTPEHVTPLRQSILELAVRGKLTRREAGDESAGELLKRIREEKAKIAKKETIAPIKDDEEPFDLPTAWEWVRLKQITIDLQTGPFGSNLHKSDYVANGIPVVNPVNMRDGKIVPLAEMMISEKTRERLSQYILEEGDLVLARRGEIGRCVLVTEKESGWLCGTGSLRMKLSENISKGFIVLLLKTDFARSRLTKETVGITMSNMSQTGLENLTFALPPLAEQERIVKRVEQLLSLCDALEASLQSAEEERGRLVRAVMSTVGS